MKTSEKESNTADGAFRLDPYKKSLRVGADSISIGLPQVTRNQLQQKGNRTLALHIQQQQFNLDIPIMPQPQQDRHSQSKMTAPDSLEQLHDSSIEKKNESSIMSVGPSQITESQQLFPGARSVSRHTESQMVLGGVDAQRSRVRSNAFLNYSNSGTQDKRRKTMYGGRQIVHPQRMVTNETNQLMDPVTSTVAIEFNSFQAMSTRNVPTKHSGTTNSQNILPGIGGEIDYRSAASQIKSKVELTRKEMQSYLINGSVSREFIDNNKQGVKKFIKQQGRATADYFRGYQTYHGTEKSGRQTGLESIKSLDTILSSNRGGINECSLMSSAKKLDEPSAQHDITVSKDFSQESMQVQPQTAPTRYFTSKKESVQQNKSIALKAKKMLKEPYVFPDDVKLERPVKGELSTRALETWVNETLLDAHHLEIPGVVANADKKSPIYSYGIDPLTLERAGLGEKDVDRIYRALFVYSVGFFEFMKKILQQTGSSYAIITSIWKVYQVLLEYCCKTDYRILIAELTDRHREELITSETVFREKIQKLKNDKTIMKQNLENQQLQCDLFEKERDQEKQQRLKLEDEYMSHQQNHEEEVKLRLKFEGKFNIMHSEHRELQINYDRKLRELTAAQNLVKEHEYRVEIQSKELIKVKQIVVNQEAQISSLAEFKQMAEKDIRNKNNTLLSAEMQKIEAMDNFQLQRYEVQESMKDLNDIKSKMEIQAAQVVDLQAALAAAKAERKVYESDRDKLQEEYHALASKFETRQGSIDELAAKLDAVNTSSKIQYNELTSLRRTHESTDKQLSEMLVENAETKAKDKTLEFNNKQLSTDINITQEQLQKMNDERHKLQEKLEKMTVTANLNAEQRNQANAKIDRLRKAMHDCETAFAEFRSAAAKKEEGLNGVITELRSKQLELEEEIRLKNTNIENLETVLKYQQDQNMQRKQEILRLTESGTEQKAVISKFVAKNRKLEDDLEKLSKEYKEQFQGRHRAEEERDDSEQRKVGAEQVSEILQQTIKSLRQQLKEEREQLEIRRERQFVAVQVDSERDMMACEEVISRFAEVMDQKDAALRLIEQNQPSVDHYPLVLEEIQAKQEELADANQCNKGLRDTIKEKEKHIAGKETVIENLHKKNASELAKLKQEHNIEMNEMEQKISQIKLSSQQDKNVWLKDKRDMQAKLKDVEKKVKDLQRQVPAPNAKKGAGKGLQTQSTTLSKSKQAQTAEIGMQTDDEEYTKLLGAEKKLLQVQKQLQKAKKAMAKAKKKGVDAKQQKSGTSNAAMQIMSDDDESSNNEEHASSQSSSKGSSIICNGTKRQSKRTRGTKGTNGKGTNEKETIEVSSSDDDDDDISLASSSEIDEKKSSAKRMTNAQNSKRKSGRNTTEGNQSRSDKDNDANSASAANKEGSTARHASDHSDDALNQSNEEYNEGEEEEDLIDMALLKQKEEELKRQQRLIELVVAEERNVLLRIEKAVEMGEVVHPNQIKIWRNEIRIPGQLYRTKLSLSQRDELQQKQDDQCDYYKLRAIRKLEEGSQYSSDYEEIEQSEYITTDGEGDDTTKQNMNNAVNLKVLRDDIKKSSHLQGDKLGEHLYSSINSEEEKCVRQEYSSQRSAITGDLTISMKSTETLKNGQEQTCLMKLANKLKLSMSNKESQSKSDQQNVQYKHEIDDNIMPVVSYIIAKNSEGNDVYKRRHTKMQRVLKNRDDDYEEKREKMLSDLAKNRSKTVENNIKKYENIYARFALNYNDTLEDLISQNKKLLLNKAFERRKISKNQEVDNIQGRGLHHFLIQQMKELPHWQIHLEKLKKELHVQEAKWDNREADRLEMERKREEIRQIEEEMERIRAQQRRESIEIVHDDRQAASAEQYSNRKRPKVTHYGHEGGVMSDKQIDFSSDVVPPSGWSREKDDTLVESLTQDNYQQQQRRITESKHESHDTGIIDEISIVSETDTLTAAAFVPMPNQDVWQISRGPQEETNEANQQLQILLEESKVQRETHSHISAELSDFTRGGVNAIVRQSQMARTQAEFDNANRQNEHEDRARKRDIILAQTGMLQKREEEKKQPPKLGPSSIRTLIRAADSRIS